MKKISVLCCLFFLPAFYSAHIQFYPTGNDLKIHIEKHSITDIFKPADVIIGLAVHERPSPLLKLFHQKQKHNKKLTAAILAFPLPFGIVGLHRIYLGCVPYVPVVYIASFGGMLGLLPLIDFCYILAEKDKDAYSNNKKVFMWVE